MAMLACWLMGCVLARCIPPQQEPQSLEKKPMMQSAFQGSRAWGASVGVEGQRRQRQESQAS